MKKSTNIKTKFVVAILLLAMMFTLTPMSILAVPTSISAGQIGTVEDGNVIFYADLNGGKIANPFSVGEEISIVSGSGSTARYAKTPDTRTDYKFFFSSASPNFSIIHSDTDDSNNGGTMVEGTTVVLSGLNYTTVQSTSQRVQCADESDPNLHYYSDYSIVAGTNDTMNVLRIEYTVTNMGSTAKYIGGRMNADTMVGSLNEATDYAQTIVDNPDRYINSASNPNGFLYDGGEVRKTSRFVDRPDGDDSYIHGIPLSWHNVMVFNETNPLSVYYSVKPDKTDTSDHFYPQPNVVDFAKYVNAIMPTGGFSPSSAGWIPLNRQRSGQTMHNSTMTSNNTPSNNTDPRTVLPFGSTSAENSATTDSGTSIQWNKKKLEPGQSISYVYFVGQGDLTINAMGSLYYGISTQSNRFAVENNIFKPINIQVSLKNSNTSTSITNAAVKLVYDSQRITPLNPDGSERPSDGTINTSLNGVTNDYNYVETTINEIRAQSFSNLTFPVLGKNTTVNELSTYTKAVIDFTDVDTTHFTDISTEELLLFIPGILEEDRSPGYIHVEHVVQGSNELLFEYDIAGVVGNRSTSYSMDFVNYGLAPGQPTEQTGTLLRSNIVGGVEIETHKYEYVPRDNDYNLGGIIIRHMGKSEIINGNTYNVLLALEHIHGVAGTQATVHNKDWPGYHYTPEEQTVTFTERPSEIVFEYDFDAGDEQGYLDVYNNSGRVLVRHVDGATGNLITQDTIIANMTLPQETADVVVNSLDINNYTLADQATKTVTVRSGGSATVDF